MKIDKSLTTPFVLWYSEGDKSQVPSVAISTSVRHDGCRNLVIQGGNRHGWGKPCVMHIDDERLANSPERRREDGAWDFTDETKRYFELVEEVNRIKEAIAAPKTAGRKAE